MYEPDSYEELMMAAMAGNGCTECLATTHVARDCPFGDVSMIPEPGERVCDFCGGTYAPYPEPPICRAQGGDPPGTWRCSTQGSEETTLGPCGCIDYHMADCPLITDRGGNIDPPEPDDDYNPEAYEED